MDKIEKIRKEIEKHRQAIRVLNEHTAPEQMSKTCAIFQYSDSILSELLSFLDTPSEEPDKSLEEAAYKYSFDSRPSIYGQVDVIDAFKAGAELQYQKDRYEFAKLKAGDWQDGFDAGRKAEREQMMKGVVEGVVTTRSMAGNIVTAHIDHQFKDGQKVRIIVLPKEDKAATQ